MKSKVKENSPSIRYENTSVAPNGWDELADEIYQTSRFRNHFFDGRGGYLAGYVESKLVTGVPYVWGSKDGKIIISSMIDFLYGGAIGEGRFRELSSKFFFNKHDVDGWLLIDFSGIELDLPNPKEASAEIIKFKDYDSWFESIDGDARNQIRQSERRGCKLGKITRKQFSVLEQNTANRHKDKIHRTWTDRLFSFGETLTAFIGKKPVASVILLKHKNKAYLVKNVSVESGFKYRPNHFVYSESVKWALRNGCTSLNTGGAPHTGLREFKRSLGSTTQKYYFYSAYK